MSWDSDHRQRARRGYHHGNLREALIKAALELIAAKGPSGFTFAEAARVAGVSPAAPYRHYRDRDALMADVAGRGFEAFEAQLNVAWAGGTPNPLAAFERVGHAYLAFARGDSGEQAQPTDMALALEELRSDAERHGHTATVVFHGLPVVTVKPASFKRCLANLVSNAARHADAIAITGHRDHRYLTVTIDDDGPGIPQDMREEVFKPFLRLDDARNQDEGGTGLGLAIARDIARSHGGDITLGESPMGGLRATVRVPV